MKPPIQKSALKNQHSKILLYRLISSSLHRFIDLSAPCALCPVPSLPAPSLPAVVLTKAGTLQPAPPEVWSVECLEFGVNLTYNLLRALSFPARPPGRMSIRTGMNGVIRSDGELPSLLPFAFILLPYPGYLCYSFAYALTGLISLSNLMIGLRPILFACRPFRAFAFIPYIFCLILHPLASSLSAVVPIIGTKAELHLIIASSRYS